MKNIMLWGYTEFNLGDDLFFKVLFDKYPNINFTLFAPKKYKQTFSNYKNVKVKNKIPIKVMSKLKFFNKYYIFNFFFKEYINVIVGGSIFMEGKYPEKSLRHYNMIINSNKPVFIIGSNFGPYESDEFFNSYNNLFKRCYDISFRERYSYELFKNLTNVRMAPDVVFNLNTENMPKEKSIGFSIINLRKRSGLNKYTEVYLNKIIELIKGFIDKNYDCYLFSFCEVEGDTLVIDEILNILPENYASKVKVHNYDGDIDNTLKVFSKMEKIIATRFHALILSQLYNQDVYPLVYSEKTKNVLDDLGINKVYCDIRDIGKLNFNKVEESIEGNKIRKGIVQKESGKHFLKLDEYLNKNNK